LRQLDEAKSLGEARELRTQLQLLQESNVNLAKNLENAAATRQEVEAKLVGQQKQLLDEIVSTNKQMEVLRQENDSLKKSTHKEQADVEAKLVGQQRQLLDEIVSANKQMEALRQENESLIHGQVARLNRDKHDLESELRNVHEKTKFWQKAAIIVAGVSFLIILILLMVR
jgi:cell division protein FtsB